MRSLLIACIAGCLLAASLRADQPPPEKVSFETVDEVELKGTFYPNENNVKAPCALLLHNIGNGHSSREHGWDQMAKELQREGYAVLTFDFRGHGQSTSVSPAFWKAAPSAYFKTGTPKKDTIDHKSFLPAYIPYLVNDIAAARRFLDAKNDARLCNSSNIVLIAAQEGATLGSMWLASEWFRRPPRVPGVNNPPAYGQDVTAAVWLTMATTLGNNGVGPKLSKWIQPLRDKTPMAFLYSEDDKSATKFAKEMTDKILKIDTPPRPKYTAARNVSGRLNGVDILGSTKEVKAIANYLQKVQEDSRGDVPWQDRDSKRAKVEFVDVKRFMQ
jgi:pimeloyl-ACP methyl ester carboxylesterase